MLSEQAGALVLRARSSSRRRARLRRWARFRSRWLWLLLLAPTGVSLALDIARRGPRIAGFSWWHLATYSSTWLFVTVVWATALYATAVRRPWLRRLAVAFFTLTFSFSLGGQAYFYDAYRSYVNRELSAFAGGVVDSIVNQLLVDVGSFCLAIFPFLLLASALVVAARFVFRPGQRQGRWTFGATVALLLLGCGLPVQSKQWQAAAPEALYFNAVGSFVWSVLGFNEASEQVRQRLRHSQLIPELQGDAPVPRNVLLVITESVRADAVCTDTHPRCPLTPATHALLPDRHVLHQLRALDSTTATSLAVLWSGLAPNASSDEMHTWPLLFDYANAAGWDTAYWTSQNLMFGNSRLWVANLGVRLSVSATTLDPEADIDLGADEALLAQHVEPAWSELHEPFLAVLHLSNTHYPYLVNEERPQPFQPARLAKGPDQTHMLRNFYQNAIVQQDEHLASMIAALRRTEPGKRTVIVYTSDHGEAMREHNQMGHTFSLYDEEIHVPGYVDAPVGTLTEREREQLKARAHAYTFHTDVAPTVLDLMGVWDSPAIAHFKSKLLGQSWLRPREADRALPLTNCSQVWSCAFENWGMMRGSLKLLARTPYDLGWRCYDVATDPTERKRLRTPDCAALEREALNTFGRLPH